MPSASYSGRGVNRARAEAIRAHAGERILDVGCGSGSYVRNSASGRSMFGVDSDVYAEWFECPGRFACADAALLPFRDASFDTVTAFEVLEHLADPLLALKEFARISSRNVILTVPNRVTTEGMRRSGLAYYHWTDRTHVNFWTLDEIRQLVVSAGFVPAVAMPINFVDLGHLIAESMRLSGPLAIAFARMFRAFQWRGYPMTSLVVANRHSPA